MPLFLRESDIARVLEMDRVIAAVEEAFVLLGQGRALNRPRRRVQNPDGSVLHVMSAALPPLGVMGLKAYTSAPSGTRFVGLLYSTDTGELLALMEATRLGQMRTGAASAVATRYMARPDAGSLGVIGTGWQARGQVIAISRVRPVALVKCYSRTAERREQFAAEMVEELGAEVVAVDSARDAVDGVDIIVTATTAREPVLLGEWLRPGVHVNAIGSNWAHKQELDVPAVSRCDRIAVDDLEQARQEAGDLIAAVSAGALEWDRVTELARIVAGREPGRASPDEVTLFESQGIALEDVAAMKVAYERALELGVGEVLSRPAAPAGDP
ncbi:MAG: ornithine cyclodeaminase family protein [Armatimonadota bacterium]|nr:ornithine cyclodeaminase family protein [Armatimonadota bacterium]MDR7401612.1 ornithine cyclodeaminase family protein [Armatimonadota bacterium]MDR7404300.1 ornithine cyclodeaminase family protein [Armatimonadota bacterium]MDR7436877.1 ornithine cyclodeaminase family protein [Armatimonadota bacterium]MDR7471582.1 ornithine cyclodeaminase family protein [Armatimonadota bacterium]